MNYRRRRMRNWEAVVDGKAGEELLSLLLRIMPDVISNSSSSNTKIDWKEWEVRVAAAAWIILDVCEVVITIQHYYYYHYRIQIGLMEFKDKSEPKKW
jgi:hypothetical protein